MLPGAKELKHPETYRERVQANSERKRLGQLGFASCFVKPLECVLKNGRLVSGMVEIYGRIEVKHSPGETFILCMTGSLRVRVGDDESVLEEGDSMTILDMGDSVYEPVSTGCAQPASAVFIYVRLNADERVTSDPSKPHEK